MKKVLRIAIVLLIVFLTIVAIILIPYALRVQRFAANPAKGYSADFYLYISPDAERSARAGQVVTILVQPNNSGVNSDDPKVHRRDAWWTGFERQKIADELGVILLVPAFIRPGEDWQILTHALDRDTLTTERVDLQRIDLQLIAMIDDARAELATLGIQTDEKVLIQGFSASGMFANRFTLLHPERVKAATIGSPGGWPIVPVASFQGEQLPYPAGIADLEQLTNRPLAKLFLATEITEKMSFKSLFSKVSVCSVAIFTDLCKRSNVPFDAVAYNAVPQLIYMGSADDNDSLDYTDGWDKKGAQVVDRLFGADPLARWEAARLIYQQAGANVQFLLIEGAGHDRRGLQKYSTGFFEKVLDGAKP